MFPSETPDCVGMMWRQPMGVVGCISPWNAALLLALRAVVFPLACGNTVVLKTSEASSVVGGVMLAQLFADAGFPAGVFRADSPGDGDGPGKIPVGENRLRWKQCVI